MNIEKIDLKVRTVLGYLGLHAIFGGIVLCVISDSFRLLFSPTRIWLVVSVGWLFANMALTPNFPNLGSRYRASSDRSVSFLLVMIIIGIAYGNGALDNPSTAVLFCVLLAFTWLLLLALEQICQNARIFLMEFYVWRKKRWRAPTPGLGNPNNTKDG